MTGPVRVGHTTASGTFSLDGGTWDVDNNVWVVGDDEECVVIDAPHEARPVLDLVAGRRVVALLCTHAHDDHITAAAEVCRAAGTTAYLHTGDRMLWDQAQAAPPGGELSHGDVFTVAGVTLQVMHTPGHSPGSCCFVSPELGVVFTGDTLFAGGPGATGRSFSDFGTIIASLRDRLLSLPGDTVVHPGHGDSTTIGVERPNLQDWVDRGH